MVLDIFIINANGTNFTQITGDIFDQLDYTSPSWAPCGIQLSMAINLNIGINQYKTDVGIINPDGRAIKILKSGALPFTRTSWSSDGTKILYTSLSGTRRDISWVSPDGSSSGTIITNGWDADWQR
jgi:Tol biopolymer transport system component